MNFRYVEAFEEIQHLVTMALLKDNDHLAMDTFKEITEKINAALDGAAGVRALPGCPSLMPAKVIPHDEPAAEVSRKGPRTQEEYFKQHYSLCDGAFPIRRGNSEECVVESCWVDKHRFTAETVVTEKVDGVNRRCEFTIRDNGKIKISGHFHGGKAIAEKVVHAALKAYITNLSGNGKHKSRGGFLKQAQKRYQEAQEKEAVNG